MNIKSLMTTSVIALISASAAHAADVVVHHEVTPPVISAPSFSWSGFYLGGQIGGFSSKTEAVVSETKEKYSEKFLPQPSGFMGGVFAGSNIDLGNGLILGVETDAVWADRGETKQVSFVSNPEKPEGEKPGNPEGEKPGNPEGEKPGNPEGEKPENPEGEKPGNPEGGKPGKPGKPGGSEGEKPGKPGGSEGGEPSKARKAADDKPEGEKPSAPEKITGSITLKEKWSGATRVRVGFAAAERIMPYVAGGVAYAQVQASGSVDVANNAAKSDEASEKFDRTKTFVGFTIGGGVDFSMADNVLLRAEYRYSDFGKKAFEKDGDKLSYKTNDFRVGVAYKF
ncbi:outer membrane immunogenic protein [Bartonella japonica]|uniref:Outer membrane immunogenic protein n=1 Tax=Bartonella japonica TaxID=357761 RepID=A0ABV2FPB9_9HYPH